MRQQIKQPTTRPLPSRIYLCDLPAKRISPGPNTEQLSSKIQAMLDGAIRPPAATQHDHHPVSTAVTVSLRNLGDVS